MAFAESPRKVKGGEIKGKGQTRGGEVGVLTQVHAQAGDNLCGNLSSFYKKNSRVALYFYVIHSLEK